MFHGFLSKIHSFISCIFSREIGYLCYSQCSHRKSSRAFFHYYWLTVSFTSINLTSLFSPHPTHLMNITRCENFKAISLKVSSKFLQPFQNISGYPNLLDINLYNYNVKITDRIFKYEPCLKLWKAICVECSHNLCTYWSRYL